MWQEYFVMGAWCWENGSNQLLITHRTQWDVDLNHEKKTSRDTFTDAKAVVDRFMQENP